jgi:hypothetical protein
MHMPQMNGNLQIAFLLHIFNLMFATPHALWPQTQIGDDWKPWVVNWPTKGKLFVNGTIRAMDVSLALSKSVLNLRIMEQNPAKRDNATGMFKPTAIRAQRGERIMWVIDQSTNTWLGSIQNGQWVPSKSRGVYPATPQPVGQVTTQTAMYAAAQNEDDSGQDASLTAYADDFIDPDRLPDVDIDIDEFVQTYCTDDEDPEAM